VCTSLGKDTRSLFTGVVNLSLSPGLWCLRAKENRPNYTWASLVSLNIYRRTWLYKLLVRALHRKE
jgi:hypothetical protein